MQIRIYDILKQCSLGDLDRIYNCEVKEFVHLDVSVFNVGVNVNVTLSNKYRNYDDGYSVCIYNDDIFKDQVNAVIRDKLRDVNKTWMRLCYEYNMSEFLGKYYKISESRYSRMIKKYEV